MSRILLGCEESQEVTKAFRELGHEAYSCDILPCSGGKPEWHLQMDIFEAIALKDWDLAIFFPPCTFIAGSGARWMYHPEDKYLPFEDRRRHPNYPNRPQQQTDAIKFATDLYNCKIPRVAIENPIGALSTRFRKPDQKTQPYEHGDKAQKSTCLWLKGLPKITPTDIVEKGEFFEFVSKKGVKKRMPMWYYKALQEAKTPEQRRTLRSKTFPGIAKAMAEQWGSLL